MKTRIAAIILASVGLAGCEGMTGPSPSSLEGTWRMASLQLAGEPSISAPAGATFEAEFGSDARISLQADCNRCGSGYEAGAGTLSVGAMACTRAYCPTAPVDTQFAGLVSAAQNWRISGGELVLTSGQGTLTLRR